MQLDDYMSTGLLRRWEIGPLGQARCRFDAVDARRISAEMKDSILTENARIRELDRSADAFSAAQRLILGEEPEPKIDGFDEDGKPTKTDNPAHIEWQNAMALVEDVTEDALMLASLRAGLFPLDDSGEMVTPVEPNDPDPLADILAEPFVPVPPVISDRQFAQELAIRGKITWSEAIAWASKGDLPSTLKSAVETLPTAGNVRNAAIMILASATDYERSHPMAGTLGALLGYTSADLDDIWRSAALL